MPSPFPGMDPYIEDPEVWSDLHSDLAAETRTALNQVLGPRYIARIIPTGCWTWAPWCPPSTSVAPMPG